VNVFETTLAELIGDLTNLEQKYAPAALFLAGDRDIIEAGQRISVVGARRVSDAGARRARALSRALVDRGFVVVSGLAEGVDTVAHKRPSLQSDARSPYSAPRSTTYIRNPTWPLLAVTLFRGFIPTSSELSDCCRPAFCQRLTRSADRYERRGHRPTFNLPW